ncbi:MAG: ABC transporter permease [Planctomycetota bacterium]
MGFLAEQTALHGLADFAARIGQAAPWAGLALGVVVLALLARATYRARHWVWMAGRNWRVKRVRTAGAVLAIALGTGAVVWVTCCYESVRRTVLEWAGGFIGKSHVTIQHPLGKYDTFPQRLVGKVEELPGVAHVAPMLIQRLYSAAEPRAAQSGALHSHVPTMDDVDFHGIDLEREFAVRTDWGEKLAAGRMLRPTDEWACVAEQSITEEQHVGLGDYVLVWGPEPELPPYRLEIVGIVQRERIARFQKGLVLVRLPILQRITQQDFLVNTIDVVVAEPERQLEQVTRLIQRALHFESGVQVHGATGRLERIRLAQEQQEVILILLSCMALLTALFIILSTLSIGMIERIAQLGLMRCVGLTGWQLAGLVMAEVLPLGVIGIILGVPLGLGLAGLTVWIVPEYVGRFVIAWDGILLAGGAGLATTIAAAALPALASATVSPLEATRPRARRAGLTVVIFVALVAAVLLAAQMHIMRYRVQRDLDFVRWSTSAIVLLYIVYALIAPLLVWLASRLAVPLTAGLVAVRSRLLQDQVGHAVWRSAGICCGLMVGLSLIVGLTVFNTSFRSGWQFPKQFPAAYIWSHDQIEGDVAAVMERMKDRGIAEYTIANAPNVIVEERPVFGEKMLRSMTWFLGIDPDSFMDMIQFEFIEGDPETAKELLKRGGHVLVAADFARTRRKGIREVRDEHGRVLVSNQVRVFFDNRWMTFTVAGVIDSPALDIAASYFQVQTDSYMAAVGSVIGTNADLQRLWGVHGARLILVEFALPPEPPPPGWPPPAGSEEAALAGISHMHRNKKLPLERRWQIYREGRILDEIVHALRANAMFGTTTELKDEIDSRLTEMTHLLTAVPAVALIVAALGVANLMTANVASRTKQLAILRAVGATRGLVLRLVLGEALILGLLGSLLGLVLGLHLAWNVMEMTERMWGYELPFAVPWEFVGYAIALTVGLCILAGILPARHASRMNVIEALRVA